MVKDLTERFSAVTPLALVLKQFLADRGLDQSYSGGLSSYCLILLITRILQHEHHHGRPINQAFADAYAMLENELTCLPNDDSTDPKPTRKLLSKLIPSNFNVVVINQFSRVAQNERCSFLGNVCLGSSITLPELRDMYNAVVLAYGAESDRSLGIPGEELAGIYAAREFVWWYNGHPDCRTLAPDLKSTDTAVILGQGNVALDAARILLRPTVELARTDIASHALAALEESSIRKVYLVGRRGPVQAACTAKELREVLGIKDLAIHIQQSDLVTTPADEIEMKNSRIRRRVHELLSKAVSPWHTPIPGQRELHFVFFRKPDRFLQSNNRSGHLGGIRLEKTILQGDGLLEKQVAVGTGVYEDISCGLALKSIGYKSVAVDGLPFDNYRGIVPNFEGRVLADASQDCMQYEMGLYVCGWLKRGPTGIIGTNLYCAEETVACITEDISKGALTCNSPKPGRGGLVQLLESRNTRVVPFNAWEKIDIEERRLGNLKNKPREKITSWEELLKLATES